MQLETSWTCTNNQWCNVLKIGDNPPVDPKFPKLAIRSGDVHLALQMNSGKQTFTVDNASVMDTLNDGQWHLYEVGMSPIQTVIKYDGVTYLNEWGSFSKDNWLPANYSLLLAGVSEYYASGIVRNLCVHTYEWTASPTSVPSENPTTFAPTAVPSESPSTTAPTMVPSESPTTSWVFSVILYFVSILLFVVCTHSITRSFGVIHSVDVSWS